MPRPPERFPKIMHRQLPRRFQKPSPASSFQLTSKGQCTKWQVGDVCHGENGGRVCSRFTSWRSRDDWQPRIALPYLPVPPLFHPLYSTTKTGGPVVKHTSPLEGTTTKNENGPVHKTQFFMNECRWLPAGGCGVLCLLKGCLVPAAA